MISQKVRFYYFLLVQKAYLCIHYVSEPENEPPIDSSFEDSENEIDDDAADVQHSGNLIHGQPTTFNELDIHEGGSSLDDAYYPSSSEEGQYKFPQFIVESDMKDPKLEVGMEFKSMLEFKEAVRNYRIRNRYNVKFKYNDNKRCQGVCKEGCPWKIWASKKMDKSTIQIKSIKGSHQCTRDKSNRHCTYKYLANHYLLRFRNEPNWKTSSFMETVRADLKTHISRVMAWKTRRYARELNEGSNKEQFGLLRGFAAELLRTNPGSTCIIALHDSIFQGIYICLDACKRAFLGGCRQLVGLDGCWLKGNFGGQLLSAVGLDANECIYPIAYAIVEKENTVGWKWFLKHLDEDLHITNSYDWTFMTDRQKGLQNVIKELYLEAEHRFCVRHMYKNFFKSDFKGKILKEYLWKAAKSNHVADFKYWMGTIEKENKAA